MKEKCPLCPKVYQSYKDLDKHCKKIHGIPEMGKGGIEKNKKRKK